MHNLLQLDLVLSVLEESDWQLSLVVEDQLLESLLNQDQVLLLLQATQLGLQASQVSQRHLNLVLDWLLQLLRLLLLLLQNSDLLDL